MFMEGIMVSFIERLSDTYNKVWQRVPSLNAAIADPGSIESR